MWLATTGGFWCAYFGIWATERSKTKRLIWPWYVSSAMNVLLMTMKQHTSVSQEKIQTYPEITLNKAVEQHMYMWSISDYWLIQHSFISLLYASMKSPMSIVLQAFLKNIKYRTAKISIAFISPFIKWSWSAYFFTKERSESCKYWPLEDRTNRVFQWKKGPKR